MAHFNFLSSMIDNTYRPTIYIWKRIGLFRKIKKVDGYSNFLVNLMCSLGKMLLPQLLHSFLRHKLDFEKLISLISHP